VKKPKTSPKAAASVAVKPGDVITISADGYAEQDIYIVGPADNPEAQIPIKGFKPKAPGVKVKFTGGGGGKAAFSVIKGAKDPDLSYLQWRLYDPKAKAPVAGSDWEPVTNGVITIDKSSLAPIAKDAYQIVLRCGKGGDEYFNNTDNYSDKSLKKSVKTKAKMFG
jgi:hypothetical protein